MAIKECEANEDSHYFNLMRSQNDQIVVQIYQQRIIILKNATKNQKIGV